MIEVDVQFEFTHGTLPTESDVQSWAQAALKGIITDAEMCVVIVDNDESQALNLQYRGKDKPTNVLSFPFEVPEELAQFDEIGHPIGDLIVCAPVVAQEAIDQNKPLMHHWAHMIIHGCLHLMGYDHIKDDEAEVMESLERQILATLGINDPYTIIDDDNERATE